MKISEWRLKMSGNVEQKLAKVSGMADKVRRKFIGVQDNIIRAKTNMRDFANEVPFLGRALDLLKNPFALIAAGSLVVGTALGFGTSKALKYEQGMAKINATAQLTGDQLEILRGRLLDVKGVQPDRVPEAYEAILSQVNDLGLSMDILETAIKGSRAGFTDLDIVSKSLAKTLSIVGKENTNAQEVLDTFFKAKEVGAGEFKDFAEYVPGLIAAGKNLGIEYKEVTGLFSFMATQSKDAARATTLLENAFSALSKKDILQGLETSGVDVFNTDGSIRRMDEIFIALKSKLDGFSSKERINFLDKIGLRDVQAKEAISILTGDVEKLTGMLDATANAVGSTKTALENTQNPLQNWQDSTAMLNLSLTKLGYTLLPAVTIAAQVLGTIFGWMADNSDLVMAALVGLGGGMVVAAISTGMLTTAVWANTIAWLANPMVWIPALLMALAAGVVYLYNEFEVFRGILWGSWEALKGFSKLIGNVILGTIEDLLQGIGGLAKAIWQFVTGDWDKAWETAKQAGNDLFLMDMQDQLVKDAGNLGVDVGIAYKKGIADVPLDSDETWMEKLGVKVPTGNGSMVPTGTSGNGGAGTESGNSNIQKGLSGISGGGKSVKNVTVTIGKLVEQITIEAKDTKAQAQDLTRMVEEALIRAIRGGELAISNEY